MNREDPEEEFKIDFVAVNSSLPTSNQEQQSAVDTTYYSSIQQQQTEQEQNNQHQEIPHSLQEEAPPEKQPINVEDQQPLNIEIQKELVSENINEKVDCALKTATQVSQNEQQNELEKEGIDQHSEWAASSVVGSVSTASLMEDLSEEKDKQSNHVQDKERVNGDHEKQNENKSGLNYQDNDSKQYLFTNTDSVEVNKLTQKTNSPIIHKVVQEQLVQQRQVTNNQSRLSSSNQLWSEAEEQGDDDAHENSTNQESKTMAAWKLIEIRDIRERLQRLLDLTDPNDDKDLIVFTIDKMQKLSQFKQLDDFEKERYTRVSNFRGLGDFFIQLHNHPRTEPIFGNLLMHYKTQKDKVVSFRDDFCSFLRKDGNGQGLNLQEATQIVKDYAQVYSIDFVSFRNTLYGCLPELQISIQNFEQQRPAQLQERKNEEQKILQQKIASKSKSSKTSSSNSQKTLVVGEEPRKKQKTIENAVESPLPLQISNQDSSQTSNSYILLANSVSENINQKDSSSKTKVDSKSLSSQQSIEQKLSTENQIPQSIKIPLIEKQSQPLKQQEKPVVPLSNNQNIIKKNEKQACIANQIQPIIPQITEQKIVIQEQFQIHQQSQSKYLIEQQQPLQQISQLNQYQQQPQPHQQIQQLYQQQQPYQQAQKLYQSQQVQHKDQKWDNIIQNTNSRKIEFQQRDFNVYNDNKYKKCCWHETLRQKKLKLKEERKEFLEKFTQCKRDKISSLQKAIVELSAKQEELLQEYDNNKLNELYQKYDDYLQSIPKIMQRSNFCQPLSNFNFQNNQVSQFRSQQSAVQQPISQNVLPSVQNASLAAYSQAPAQAQQNQNYLQQQPNQNFRQQNQDYQPQNQNNSSLNSSYHDSQQPQPSSVQLQQQKQQQFQQQQPQPIKQQQSIQHQQLPKQQSQQQYLQQSQQQQYLQSSNSAQNQNLQFQQQQQQHQQQHQQINRALSSMQSEVRQSNNQLSKAGSILQKHFSIQ